MSKFNNINNKQSNRYQPLPFVVPVIVLFILGICFLLTPLKLHAQDSDKSIVIIYQSSQDFSQQLITNLQQSFKSSGYKPLKVMLTPDNTPQKIKLLKTHQYKLLIAIGSETTKTLLDANIQTPILSALIPRHIYKSLKQTHKNKNNWSSLLINQPIERQLQLITAVMGKNKKTAILLGPYTKDLNQPLNKASTKTTQHLSIQEIKTSDQIPEALDSLNSSVDVLLTIPDPVIYNRNTLRGILLASYRKKLPLIGFSQSYVKSGAIAAIYSKPEQISQQISDITKSFFIHQSFKKTTYYPNDFSLALNKNIARSLGIKLAPSQTIVNQIKKAEKNQ